MQILTKWRRGWVAQSPGFAPLEECLITDDQRLLQRGSYSGFQWTGDR